MGHSKLVSPLGTKLWKLSDLFQFWVIEESRASEGWKIKFFKREILTFWELNSNFWAKTIYKSSLNFWNRLIVVITRPNLEIDTTQSSKFSKFGLTSQLHSFPWLKNTPYFNFRIKIDRITCVWFSHLLRPCSLRLGKFLKNCLDFTYQNPKEQLIFGAPS